ncbi:MAG: penicillin-binding transpeptidase domain-containing protein [Candidatus Babeliales bacterium]
MNTHGTILDQSSKLIACSGIFFFCLLLARVFYLQIYLNQELFKRAQKNFTRYVTIPSQRGNILDCNGTLLATNRPVINIFWQGTGNHHLTTEQTALLETMGTILEQPFDAHVHKEITATERYSRTRLLATDVPLAAMGKLLEKYPHTPNLYIEQTAARFYPHKTVASHIIGYISSLENNGKMGLEKILEQLLHGSHGTLMTTINSVGARLNTLPIKEALDGQDIVTTLDLRLQLIAEQCFEESQLGVLLLMDPATGAIKALVSRPTFDPNIFLQTIDSNEWKELQEKKPFLNRAFNACYPPASPFKLITLAAAMELDLISPETTIYCPGYTRFCNRAYHCAKKAGHGVVTIEQAVAQSCNILFFDIAKRISIDQLAEYAYRFGLGQKSSVIFNEHEGIVPSKAWKWKVKHEPWWSGETLSVVIGQGYLGVTPIQMARMISAIFSGNLVKPRILEQEEIVTEPLRIRPQTRKLLKKCMKEVVTHGTGIMLRSLLPDMKLYAKTGTAQVSDLSKRDLGTEFLEHGWSVCYLKAPNQRPLVLVAVLEHVGSSQVAIAFTKRFLQQYRELIKR